jgi:anti-sigma factor ChrR (cupin superfamily)
LTDSLNGEPVGEHPSSEEVAAYLSNALTPNDRAILEAHLAVCPQCRREVTSARRLIRSHASSTVVRWAVPAAAAAAVLAVVLLSPPKSDRLEVASRRAAQDAAVSATTPRISIVSPASADTVNGSQVVFVWQKVGKDLLYRLTLTDASGNAVWTKDTPDTTLTLPASLSLGKSQNYFWFVDALGADGTALTTGTHRFTTEH